MKGRLLLAPWLSANKLSSQMTSSSPQQNLGYKYSRAKLVMTVLLFRLFYLSAMAISCHFIPDHNPGDGVLKFDMRLKNPDDCYCLTGHACDYELRNSIDDDSSIDCAIAKPVSDSFVEPSVWNFFLEPLTKWDAARFLTLAVNPSLRDPDQNTLSFQDSEQAHAFLPMFPSTIQQLSLLLYRIVPSQLLPPTFESLVVFSGMVFNNFICLSVAIMALYSLTISIMSGSKAASLQREHREHHHSVAVVVCLVFGVWNPALVFFATNYSESFFAATTFLGHLCIQRSKNGGSVILWFAGIACWMVGSYTRSNGTLQCLWLLQDGLARMILLHRKQNANPKRASKISILGRVTVICTQTIMGAILVAFPVRYHDWRGWERHCVSSEVRPSWCSYNDENPSILGSSFSLYGHIQDKHWNVGFFRYYEWKQIPNFLLAAPILLLSITGVYKWIHWSLITVYGKGKCPSSFKNLFVGWPFDALAESVSSSGMGSKTAQPIVSTESNHLLENPHLLGHYAILAILAFLGLTIAHVQISTRMICSTSPAIIWLIAKSVLGLSFPSPTGDAFPKLKGSSLIWIYVRLFMFLGVILHVNFLPWT